MPTETEIKAKPDRRERFREYMRKLNPTAPARAVIELGLTVQNLHGPLHQTLAARADLDPDSQQLIVGGVGSGKTTELLLVERWLKEHGRTICLYIDISSETDLSGLNSGALLAGFGLHLSSAFKEQGFDDALSQEKRSTLKALRTQIRHFAFGKTESVWVSDYDYEREPPDNYDPSDYEPTDYEPTDYEPGHYVTRTTPGKLQPPFPPLQREIEVIRKPLEFFVEALQSRAVDTVVLFDGLDRLITPEKFWSVVHQDFRALRRLRVSVLAAAPLSILYGTGRPVSEHFDRVHHIPTLQVAPGKTSSLRSVLVQRGGLDLVGRVEIETICRVSGGVLRDLITLARDAGEAAYMDGSEYVKATHVRAAAKQLGEGYLRGVSTDQLKVLRALIRDRAFDVSSKLGIELLVTRRVLEYSATDFRVHPALEPLITLKQKNG